MEERKNVITIGGNPLTLIGIEVKSGDKAPSVSFLDGDLKDVKLEDFKGKIKLIATVPSLDTPVCDLEIKRFNSEAVNISKDVVIIFVSMDLPFAQKRFCQANEIENVKAFSDHREADFGNKFGVLIKELRLLSRAIFIIDKDNNVCYTEYVKEITSHPDYSKALEALKNVK